MKGTKWLKYNATDLKKRIKGKYAVIFTFDKCIMIRPDKNTWPYHS